MNEQIFYKRIIYLASQNKHKQQELSDMLGSSWDVRLADELGEISWEETGKTFVENSKIKADALRKFTNECILADDSGLEVEILDNAPGIYSSRYSGADASDSQNNQHLIAELKKIKAFPAKARFVCCIYFVDEEGNESSFEGYCNGQIVEDAKGSYGFGYDPHFEIPELNKTMAELLPEEKNKISHRKNALAFWHAKFANL